jgi:predicted KAP-like P-loop ATPase
MQSFSELLASSADRYQCALGLVDRCDRDTDEVYLNKLKAVVMQIEQVNKMLLAARQLLDEVYEKGCSSGSQSVRDAIAHIESVKQVLEKAG